MKLCFTKSYAPETLVRPHREPNIIKLSWRKRQLRGDKGTVRSSHKPFVQSFSIKGATAAGKFGAVISGHSAGPLTTKVTDPSLRPDGRFRSDRNNARIHSSNKMEEQKHHLIHISRYICRISGGMSSVIDLSRDRLLQMR